MADYSPKYLVFVDGEFGSMGINKKYSMTKNSDTTFIVEWGRIGGSMASKEYPLSKWDSTYNSKIKKGYIDRSELMKDVIEDSKIEPEISNSNNDEFSVIKNISVREIIKRLFDFSNKVIQANYKTTSEQVTQAMIDTAQEYIDELSNTYKGLEVTQFNTILQNIFVTIPRKMRSVKDYLAKDKNDFVKIIEREQDLLDTMRGQVYKKKEKVEKLSATTTTCFKNLIEKDSLVSHIKIDPVTLDVTIIDVDGNELLKNQLSAGEQQMFAISIVWALALTSGYKAPVIIDTPMARLDSSHRANFITKYLPAASSQVMVLSTDEEVYGRYLDLIRDNVMDYYTLLYREEEQCTCIISGYFGEV